MVLKEKVTQFPFVTGKNRECVRADVQGQTAARLLPLMGLPGALERR